MKPIPVLYERKEDCCGCTACYAICPKSAIEMKEDEEGFEYPHIQEDKCVRCGMCLMACPTKEAKAQKQKTSLIFPLFLDDNMDTFDTLVSDPMNNL